MPSLTLTYQPEDEWHGEVTLSVESSDYTGRSSAWFGIAELRAFGDALDEFPIPTSPSVSLVGGYWNKDKTIDQIHVGLSIAPYDRAGKLVVAAHLSTPFRESPILDLRHCMTAHILTSYGNLASFRTDFLSMIEGKSAAAALDGD